MLGSRLPSIGLEDGLNILRREREADTRGNRRQGDMGPALRVCTALFDQVSLGDPAPEVSLSLSGQKHGGIKADGVHILLPGVVLSPWGGGHCLALG